MEVTVDASSTLDAAYIVRHLFHLAEERGELESVKVLGNFRTIAETAEEIKNSEDEAV